MPDGYGSHADYIPWVADDAKARQKAIEKALRDAFSDFIETRKVVCRVIYYPFIDEHINIQNRLSSDNIDVISFASESRDSIENAVRMLLARLGVDR